MEKEITVVYKGKEYDLVVDKHGIGEWKIKKVLNLPIHISLYVRVECLKEVDGNDVVKLVPNEYAKSLMILLPDQLESGKKYTIETKDIRQDYVSQLQEEEINDIRDKFDAMDVDKKGYVTIDTVQQYYRNLIDVKKQSLLEKSKSIISNNPDDKQRVEEMYRKASMSLDNLVEISVNTFMQQGPNSESVEWETFLLSQAPLLRQGRSILCNEDPMAPHFA